MQKLFFLTGLLVLVSGIMTNIAYSNTHPAIKNFDPVKTIIHTSNQYFNEIENPTSIVLIEIEENEFNISYANFKYEEIAIRECEKFEDKTYIATLHGDFIRAISNHRAKFYCSTIQDQINYWIQAYENISNKCAEYDLMETLVDECSNSERIVKNLKFDLKEIVIQQEIRNQQEIHNLQKKIEICISFGFEDSEALGNCVVNISLKNIN